MTLPHRYTGTAIALHWIVGALILVNIALAWTWPNVADGAVRPLIDTHKSIGVTVLGLVAMRLLWRWTHTPPPLPAHHKPWERRAAHWTHVALYVLMVAMPLSGWIMDSAWDKAAANPMPYFGLFTFPRIGVVMALDPHTKKQIHDAMQATHELSAKLLYALFALHVAGALKHQYLDKDRELARMGVGRGQG